MATSLETAKTHANYWRIARWTAAVALLLTPLVMMQISDEWNWELGSFIAAGVMIGGAGLLFELALRIDGRGSYRAGAAVAITACFLIIWTTIVRDDGNGIGYFMVVLAAGVGTIACWCEAAGMARTMLGVAVLQVFLGVAIATAPVTAHMPGASVRELYFSGFFAIMWVMSSACYWLAATVRAE